MNFITLSNYIFPQNVIRVCQLLQNYNKEAFIVGGSIRDIILGLDKPIDWDIATNATPFEVINIFKEFVKVIPTGLKHGTVTLIFPEFNIEVTTFRIENDYKDGRRPSNVFFVKSIKEDLSRRDLTINAIAYDPINKKLIDPFNGINDIENKIIRMVGEANERLREDGLRLIRIFRFMSILDFVIDSYTYDAISNHFEVFDKVSKERILSEFQKLLLGKKWKESLLIMAKNGLLNHVIPQLAQNELNTILPRINKSRLNITLEAFGYLPQNCSLNLKYTILFHQISAIKSNTEKIFPLLKFIYVQDVLKELKFSKKQSDDILQLLNVHILPIPYFDDESEEIKNYNTRKLLYKVNYDFLNDYLIFNQIKEKLLQITPKITDKLIKDIISRSKIQKPIYIKDLVINGDEIIQFFDLNKNILSQREFIGLILEIIRERVEINPIINRKRDLLDIFENLKRILSQCKAPITRLVRIISTDHIRKLYRNGNPEYSSWESNHTYLLSQWLIKCILQGKSDSIVIFDGTNLNLPNHPHHRELLANRFKKYKPFFINISATEDEVKKNSILRENEIDTIKKSDADLSIYARYKSLLYSFPDALSTPKGYESIDISTHNNNYLSIIKNISEKILINKYRFIILGGNVLTGKTYTAYVLQSHLEEMTFKKSENLR